MPTRTAATRPHRRPQFSRLSLERLEERVCLAVNMVADVNASPASSYPTWLTNLDETLYFTASDGFRGGELWKSDGTSDGTVLVRDLTPDGSTQPEQLIDVAGTLFFVADVPQNNWLWKSDGTAEGTQPVSELDSSYSANFVASDGLLYFTLGKTFGRDDTQLWRSDGTEAGTFRLKSDDDGFSELTDVAGTLFFVEGETLRKSNGTVVGTRLGEIRGAFSWPQHLTDANGRLFFTASHPTTGRELWVSDGTDQGTKLVRDILPGQASANPTEIVAVGRDVFFAVGKELWRSDGTLDGTVLVAEIHPETGSVPRNLIDADGTLFFTVRVPSGHELWKSDGSADGTVLVGEIPFSRLEDFVSVEGLLFFSPIDDLTFDFYLWKSDGTADGTGQLDVPGLIVPSYPPPVAAGNTLFFQGVNDAGDWELWKSDGSAEGTTMVKDIAIGTNSGVGDMTNIGGTVFFVGDDGIRGAELWKTDGSPEGTELVKEIRPSRSWFSRTFLTSVGDAVYFVTNDGIHGDELWKSDGTDQGTMLVKDISPGSPSTGFLDLIDVDGTVFFTTRTRRNTATDALWKKRRDRRRNGYTQRVPLRRKGSGTDECQWNFVFPAGLRTVEE